MYHKILLAVAEDEALAGAVGVTAAYARQWSADVRVLHVHQADPNAPNGSDRRLVKSVVERLESDGVRTECEIRLPERGQNVGSVIAGTATRAGADLVAIGSRGRSALGALFRSSVCCDVACGLDAPVIVPKGSSAAPAAPRTIEVGVDGSPASDEAVAEAAEVARAFAAAVVVVHVSPLTTVDGGAIAEPEEEGRAIVECAVARLEARGVNAAVEMPLDHSAANGVVRAAERHGADLVVLGSRRPSHLGGLVLGSVAHEAIHRLGCPVLLAHRVRTAEAVA